MPGTPICFETTVDLNGKTATGMKVPDGAVASLASGKKPRVYVTVGPHTYRSTIAVYNGVFMLPLSAENRTAAGVSADDEVSVTVALDTDPREIEVPDDLRIRLDAVPEAARVFEALSNSNKRRHVDPIEQARTAETRQRRIERTIESLLS